LTGPVDVGNTFVGRPGILQMILVMANSDDHLQQVISSPFSLKLYQKEINYK
jgi:hypothetical protein